MIRRLIFSLIVFVAFSCSNNKSHDDSESDAGTHATETSAINNDSGKIAAGKQVNQPLISDTSIRMNVYKNTEVSGWGYDILVGENLRVHQPNVPAVPGNNGFETREKAEKAAALMIFKMRNNIMPPAVSTRELDSIGAL